MRHLYRLGAAAAGTGALAAAIATCPSAAGAGTPPSSCTIVVPARRATLEARLPDAADFCGLASHALAVDLFHAPAVVLSDRLWHYPDAAIDCRLRYRLPPDRMTIRNAEAACSWFTRHGHGWHLLRRAGR